ncbi:hypothetical protein GCM10022416_60360 [Actinomadura keratinilytica]|uniref:Acyl-CoA dehydrogenase/oxidase N-terminal domain-containing protein n=1 Tax=Actinomadura keratinilytica TaxID=547461 RepID=A0ABP6UJM4_9ACTN
MAIGLTEEHEALAESVRGFAERAVPQAVVRAALEADEETRPAFWPALAEQGLLGLHLPEEHGGQGYGLLELAVALEELGRAAAPGPYLPTVLAAAAINASGNAKARGELLPDLAGGTRTAALATAGELTDVRDGGGLVVSGAADPVLGAALADVVCRCTAATPRSGSPWTPPHWPSRRCPASTASAGSPGSRPTA